MLGKYYYLIYIMREKRKIVFYIEFLDDYLIYFNFFNIIIYCKVG